MLTLDNVITLRSKNPDPDFQELCNGYIQMLDYKRALHKILMVFLSREVLAISDFERKRRHEVTDFIQELIVD